MGVGRAESARAPFVNKAECAVTSQILKPEGVNARQPNVSTFV